MTFTNGGSLQPSPSVGKELAWAICADAAPVRRVDVSCCERLHRPRKRRAPEPPLIGRNGGEALEGGGRGQGSDRGGSYQAARRYRN